MFLRSLHIDWNAISANSYLHQIPALRKTDELVFRRPITLFAGENGSGKSTLLEAIAITAGFNPEGGTLNYRFHTADTHSELHEALKLIREPRRPKYGYFLRSESFYNLATQSEKYFSVYGGKSLHRQSHGESFMSFMTASPENGIFLIDEPEASLSPQRQLALLLTIHERTVRGSQFLIATHSPILLGLPDAAILSFDGDQIQPIAYEDTESYRVTELFLRDRPTLLNRLLNQTEKG